MSTEKLLIVDIFFAYAPCPKNEKKKNNILLGRENKMPNPLVANAYMC